MRRALIVSIRQTTGGDLRETSSSPRATIRRKRRLLLRSARAALSLLARGIHFQKRRGAGLAATRAPVATRVRADGHLPKMRFENTPQLLLGSRNPEDQLGDHDQPERLWRTVLAQCPRFESLPQFCLSGCDFDRS